jgi:hypothetical protein
VPPSPQSPELNTTPSTQQEKEKNNAMASKFETRPEIETEPGRLSEPKKETLKGKDVNAPLPVQMTYDGFIRTFHTNINQIVLAENVTKISPIKVCLRDYQSYLDDPKNIGITWFEKFFSDEASFWYVAIGEDNNQKMVHLDVRKRGRSRATDLNTKTEVPDYSSIQSRCRIYFSQSYRSSQVQVLVMGGYRQ